ncbi:MAG: hypothetical protein Q9210_004635 [Variospora velana]
MASLHDNIAELGYTVDRPRRGYPSALVQDMQLFLQKWSGIELIDELTDLYLCERGTVMFKPYQHDLSYPTDREKFLDITFTGEFRITRLVHQAFDNLRFATSDTATASSSFSAVNAGSTNAKDDDWVAVGRKGVDKPESVTERMNQQSDTMTKAHSPISMPQSEAALPGPLVAQSKKDLAIVIKQWMDDHPSQRFPEVTRYDRYSIEGQFATEATLTESGERIWITRLGVVEQYLGHLLEKADGTCMLVKTCFLRKYGGHVYFPWLGGDLGFSDKEVAHHRNVPKHRISIRAYARKRDLNAEDILNEYDISKDDLEHAASYSTAPEVPFRGINAAEESDSSLTSLSSLAPLIHNFKARKAQLQASPPKVTKKKRSLDNKAPPPRPKAIKLETQDEPSGITTSQAQAEIRDCIFETNPEVGRSRHSHLTSPPLGFSASTGPAILGHNKNISANALQTPPASTLGTPFTPATSPGQVIFHFFLSDPLLGAIPHAYPAVSLPSKKRFFNQAVAAHETVGSKGEVLAASVSFGAGKRAVVVRKDGGGKAAWEEVGRVIKRMEVEGAGRVEVEHKQIFTNSCLRYSISAAMALEKDVFNLAAANVEPLDDPHEKKRMGEQMLFMKRIPNAALAAIMSGWLYFGYLFKCLLDAQAAGLSGSALKMAWLSFAMQLASAIPAAMPQLLAFSAMGKAKQQPPLRLAGSSCPSVDILVTYCGEEVDVLTDTVRAAASIDYPRNRFRVIVLDDSVSADIKAEIEKIGSVFKNVFYSTRGSKPKSHTRAGNLNHGLRYVSTLPGGSSDLFTVLDVDMIASPHLLRALVPHLLGDPKIALANPPQRAYNIPDGDPLGQSMDMLFDVIEPSKHATNSAWCTGTGFVVRRSAIDAIGGIPEESINDDILTSFCLSAAGWKIVYVHEDVQWGLVPASISSHIKQMKRWCAGITSTGAQAWNPRAQKMTLGEKFGALSPAFYFLMAVTLTTINLVLMPILLMSGAPLVAYSTDSQLRTISVLFMARFGAKSAYNFLATRATNYHLSLLGGAASWVIPFQFVTLVRSALSVLPTFSIFTRGTAPVFTPTGTSNVQDAKTFAGRLKTALWNDGFAVHVAIVASLVAGLVGSMNAASQAATDDGFWSALFVRAAWPPIFLIWSAYLLDCWTPLSYALSPPVPMNRETLVDRDAASQVAYPNDYAKDPIRIRPSQTVPLMKMAYCFGACAVWAFRG